MIVLWAVAVTTMAAGAAAPGADVPGLLRADPRLWTMHQAYLEYLDAHEELAQLEGAWLEFALAPQNRPEVAAFEGALDADTALRDAYTRYFRQLGAIPDGPVRATELAAIERELPEVAAQGLAYLKEHPQWAARFLGDAGTGLTTPAPVAPLARMIRENPALRQRLTDTFRGLLEGEDAAAALAPWWQMLAGAPTGTARTARDFEQRLRDTPAMYRLWQQRSALLADAPDAARRIRDWHGALSADPRLAEGYPAYLQRELTRPGGQPPAAGEPDGPVAPWPSLEPPSAPFPDPPRLPEPPADIPGVTEPAAPLPQLPAPPAALPAMPEMPRPPRFPGQEARPRRTAPG